MSRLRFASRVIAVAAILFSGTAIPAGPAVADEAYDAPTRAALQGVITKQLDAFAHEDAVGAEALASPAIRQKFPDPAKFFAMVREHYAALLKPKSTQFTDTASSPHGPLQKVTVVAADGSVWTAIYSFEQVDGTWRITGCGLAKDEHQQDI